MKEQKKSERCSIYCKRDWAVADVRITDSFVNSTTGREQVTISYLKAGEDRKVNWRDTINPEYNIFSEINIMTEQGIKDGKYTGSPDLIRYGGY